MTRVVSKWTRDCVKADKGLRQSGQGIASKRTRGCVKADKGLRQKKTSEVRIDDKRQHRSSMETSWQELAENTWDRAELVMKIRMSLDLVSSLFLNYFRSSYRKFSKTFASTPPSMTWLATTFSWLMAAIIDKEKSCLCLRIPFDWESQASLP